MDQLGFQHAANAIAAFEVAGVLRTGQRPGIGIWVATDSAPYGVCQTWRQSFPMGGSCASCHSGNLMTDQQHHNVGIPQLGPGKDPDHRLGPGDAPSKRVKRPDEFAFSHAALAERDVDRPLGHTTVRFTNLEGRHSTQNRIRKLRWANYDVTQLDELLQPTVKT